MKKLVIILPEGLLSKDNPVEFIAVASGKGGVGKSTLSYHLGCALGTLILYKANQSYVLFRNTLPMIYTSPNSYPPTHAEKDHHP